MDAGGFSLLNTTHVIQSRQQPRDSDILRDAEQCRRPAKVRQAGPGNLDCQEIVWPPQIHLKR